MSDLDETRTPADDDTDRTQPAAARPRGERVLFALRQAAILTACLVIGGGLVGALRPDEAADRDITASPFMWAAVLWVIVLLLDAVVFERSQIRRLEREPMALAAIAGAITFVVGLVGFDAGSVTERIVYLGANALGAFVFWWAVFSLLWLLSRLSRSTP